jgi:hypothetical protein
VTPIREEDMVLAAAFVDGELREPERTRFELRVAADPELAAAVEDLLGTDTLVRDCAGSAPAAARRRLRLLPTALLLAAAAVVAFFALRGLLAPVPAGPKMLVALAPGYESAEELVASVPALAGLHPPGLDALRGAGDEPNVDARTFVERAAQAERGLFDALGTHAAAPAVGFFVLPLRCAEARSVLVLGFPAQGAPLRYWPAPDDARPLAERGRVARGDTLLPGPRFRFVDDAHVGHVVYERGFLVPVAAGTVAVVVASRAAPLDADALALADRLLAPGSGPAQAIDALHARGFDVARLAVREP